MSSFNYEFALQVSASACTFAQFLSGFLICANFIKRGKVSNESSVPFVAGFLSCSLWLYYGMLLANHTLVSVNALGSLLFSIYIWMYLKYSSKKKRVMQYVISSVVVIVWIVYITDINAHQKQLKNRVQLRQQMEIVAVTPLDPKQPDSATVFANTNDAIERVGFICCLSTMLFFAAPLSNLIHVVRTKNSESLPMPLIVMTFLGSAQWLVYGRILRDKFIMYPNAVGCALSIVQLALFVLYPRRSLLSSTDHHNHHHPYNKLMDA